MKMFALAATCSNAEKLRTLVGYRIAENQQEAIGSFVEHALLNKDFSIADIVTVEIKPEHIRQVCAMLPEQPPAQPQPEEKP